MLQAVQIRFVKLKYFPGHSDFPSEDDIKSDPDLSPAGHSLDEPIDYEKLKAAIAEFGPIQMTRAEQRLKVIMNISPCPICTDSCAEDIITAVKVSGATSITTLIDRNALLAAETLNGFFEDFLHNPFVYFSASAESQSIEREIERHLGFNPLDVFHGKLNPQDVKPKLSEEYKSDFWKAHALQSIYRTLLLQRLEIGEFSDDDFCAKVEQRFENSADFRNFLRGIYDRGFLTARLIPEHFIRSELEPYVEKGEASEEAQKRRNKASGDAANKKRHLRVSMMLDRMEVLIKENPALKRLDVKTIADMAIEDAANSNPALWSQGRGRRDDYVEELKVDHRYRKRFIRLLGERP